METFWIWLCIILGWLVIVVLTGTMLNHNNRLEKLEQIAAWHGTELAEHKHLLRSNGKPAADSSNAQAPRGSGRTAQKHRRF